MLANCSCFNKCCVVSIGPHDDTEKIYRGFLANINATELEHKFSSLVENLLTHLKNSNVGIDELTGRMSSLPRSINIYVYPMWVKVTRKVSTHKTLDNLFTILNMEVWNILDYSLVEHLISTYDNKELKEDMRAYISELNNFKSNTLVVDFIRCWEGHNRSISDLEEVKFKFEKDKLTLEHLDNFRKSLSRQCFPSLLDLAGWIYYKNFNTGCFVVTWLLPIQLAILLKHHMRCTHAVLAYYGVVEVVIGNRIVYDHHHISQRGIMPLHML